VTPYIGAPPSKYNEGAKTAEFRGFFAHINRAIARNCAYSSSMTDDSNYGSLRVARGAMRQRHDRTLLTDLIAVLEAHPAGLRRWSVMRAMRTRRERAGHEITLKFEDEIERLFREYCVSEPPQENETRPFFKPKEKAGEVWAVDPARLPAFLERADQAA